MEGGGDVSSQLMDFDKELAELLFGDNSGSGDFASTLIEQQQQQQQQQEQQSSNVTTSDLTAAEMTPVAFDLSAEAIVDALPDLMGLDVNLLAQEAQVQDPSQMHLTQSQDPFLFEQSGNSNVISIPEDLSTIINVAVSEASSEDAGVVLLNEEFSNPNSVSSDTTIQQQQQQQLQQQQQRRVRSSSSRSSDEGIGMTTTMNSGTLDVITDVEQILDVKPAQSAVSSPAQAPSPASPASPKGDSNANKSLLSTPVNPAALANGSNSSLCYVCKEKAGKHNYYGGRVCPSCRAFFRRAVQSKYYEIFFCTKGERCEINLNTRRSCQYCRFKKCLESGMRIAWVLPDGERTKKYNKVVKLQQEQEEIINRKFMPLVKNGPTITIANEELAVLNKTQQTICKIAMGMYADYLKRSDKFLLELSAVSYFGGKVSYDFLQAFYKFCRDISFELLMGMEEFKSLPINDRRQLMEVNGNLINQFKTALSIDDDACVVTTLHAAEQSGHYPALTQVVEKGKKLGSNPRKPVLEYSQFYQSPWAATYEDEQKHYWLIQQMRNWPRDSPGSKIDDLQVTLGKLVIAFCTDFVQLERPDIVEKVQMRYSYLLQRYLKAKYNEDANKRFMTGLMLTSFARQAEEIQSRRLPV